MFIKIGVSTSIKSFSFNGMDVKKVKKFVKNGMTYLYYWEGIKRYAFTVSNDQVIDAYGIREWVNEMEMLEKLGSTGCIFIGL